MKDHSIETNNMDTKGAASYLFGIIMGIMTWVDNMDHWLQLVTALLCCVSTGLSIVIAVKRLNENPKNGEKGKKNNK